MFDDIGSNRYERLLRGGSLTDDQGIIVSGVARSLRLSHRCLPQEEKVARATAANIIGPLVFFFVWWVLHSALRQGIKRLYFLARDGHLFFKVAETLIKDWRLDLEVRYLFCSRESLLLASFHKTESFEKYWITWGSTGNISWEEICARLDLSLIETKAILYESGLGELFDRPRQPISRSLRSRVSDLLEKENFNDLIRIRAQARYELTRSYLRQEGLIDGVSFGLVDTGWRGTSQFALSGILAKRGERPAEGIRGFYLGLNRGAYTQSGDHLEAFLFDWRNGRRDDRLYNFLCFEMLCSTTHGRTTGYQREGNSIVPILGAALDASVMSQIDCHHEVTENYALAAARHFRFNDFQADNARALVRRIIREFICQPSLDQAAVYGNWPMASEMREGDYQLLAPPMDFLEFLCCSIGRRKIRGFWPQASLLRGKQRLPMVAYNLFLRSGLLDWYRRTVLRY